MKRFLIVVLSLLMACFSFSFVSCGKSNNECSSISLSNNSLNLTVGDQAILTATIAPTDTTNKQITWESSNTAVADYVNGKIVALSEGNCIIKATCGNKTATCLVGVSKKKVTVATASFGQSEYIINVNDEKTLILTISPDNVEEYSTEIVLSNQNIITAEQNSASPKLIDIKGLREGECTITLNFAGGQTCSTKIRVVDMNKLVNISIEPDLPTVVGYKNGRYNSYYNKVKITKAEVVILPDDETGFIVCVDIYFEKVYDEDGNTATSSIDFGAQLYKENDVFCEQFNISPLGTNYIVGSKSSVRMRFGVSTDWQTVRQFTVKFVDRVI